LPQIDSAGFLLGLLFDPEDGSDMFRQHTDRSALLLSVLGDCVSMEALALTAHSLAGDPAATFATSRLIAFVRASSSVLSLPIRSITNIATVRKIYVDRICTVLTCSSKNNNSIQFLFIYVQT
jgi:hypothetical protein